MWNTGCCVPKCSKLGGHKFPNDPYLRKLWIIAIKRDQWTPSKHSVVCKSHFAEDDYLSHTVSDKYSFI